MDIAILRSLDKLLLVSYLGVRTLHLVLARYEVGTKTPVTIESPLRGSEEKNYLINTKKIK